MIANQLKDKENLELVTKEQKLRFVQIEKELEESNRRYTELA